MPNPRHRFLQWLPTLPPMSMLAPLANPLPAPWTLWRGTWCRPGFT